MEQETRFVAYLRVSSQSSVEVSNAALEALLDMLEPT